MDPVSAFRQVLDPYDNSTGGGSASALAGAMAAALAAMVARLSSGRGQAAPGGSYQELSAAGETLSRELAAGAGLDAEAFAAIKAAYRQPRENAPQRSTRTAAIQAALLNAAEVPLANADLCARALELVQLLDGRANPNALSDLQCASFLASAGLAGCLANVDINLAGIKDQARVAALRTRAAALRALVPHDVTMGAA